VRDKERSFVVALLKMTAKGEGDSDRDRQKAKRFLIHRILNSDINFGAWRLLLAGLLPRVFGSERGRAFTGRKSTQ
jgi:hypothetical protein